MLKFSKNKTAALVLCVEAVTVLLKMRAQKSK
jgi:hypothetical protein